MTSLCHAASLDGIDAAPVRVEVDVSRGAPGFAIVGLGDLAVQEARERVGAAIRNAGFDFPLVRKTVNLAPSDRKKAGSHYDLAIAVGLLAASGSSPAPDGATALLGELGLDGSLREARGILPLVLGLGQAGFRRVIVPAGNAREAALARGVEILSAASLSEVVRGLAGSPSLRRHASWRPAAPPRLPPELAAIRGQEIAKRALEISAAGGHALLLSGPPGSGKTLLAEALCGLLPPLSWDEVLETTAIHSLSGTLAAESPVILHPPLRRPHHGSSSVALVGGSNPPRPGEVSLATNGVLFLDELPLFRKDCLDALREPLEHGWVEVNRARGSIRFPARALVVAAMNPCPCGPAAQGCRCEPGALARYRGRLPGPVLDRIDLVVPVARTDPARVLGTADGETSALVAARVLAARDAQRRRGQACRNGAIPLAELDHLCPRSAAAADMLARAAERLLLSGRGLHRTLRVARTVADLAGAEEIAPGHVAEALQFRAAGTP